MWTSYCSYCATTASGDPNKQTNQIKIKLFTVRVALRDIERGMWAERRATACFRVSRIGQIESFPSSHLLHPSLLLCDDTLHLPGLSLSLLLSLMFAPGEPESSLQLLPQQRGWKTRLSLHPPITPAHIYYSICPDKDSLWSVWCFTSIGPAVELKYTFIRAECFLMKCVQDLYQNVDPCTVVWTAADTFINILIYQQRMRGKSHFLTVCRSNLEKWRQ